MTTEGNKGRAGTPPVGGHDTGHGGHGWMMMVCCIPMVAIALGLVIAGAVSPGFLLVAGGCVAMMALMMRTMDMGGDDRAEETHRHTGH